MDQPERDVEPPLHAAGVGLDLAVGGVGEPEALEHLGRARLHVGDPVQLALEHEVLAPGGLGIGAVLLADDADRAAHGHGLRQDVVPGHPRGAGIRAG